MGRLNHFCELLYNRLVTHIPHNPIRIAFLKKMGAIIGGNVYLYGGSEIICPARLTIGDNCHIGRFCQIDARGGINIGHNVCIASHTLVITADHNIHSPNFEGRLGAVEIGDYVWLCSRVIVVKGVKIGNGAVVAAGSVVTKEVLSHSVVSGVPAVCIGSRSSHLTYDLSNGPVWY
jgi:putative colanic acid biosynthesis acetyltransferase WcaF